MKILVINKTNASHTTNKQWKFDRKQHPTLGALPHLPPGVYIAMQVRGYIIKIANIIIIINNSHYRDKSRLSAECGDALRQELF